MADSEKEFNTSGFRILIPAKRLAQAGHHSFVTHIAEVLSGNIAPDTIKEVDAADIIIIERLPLSGSHAFIEKQIKRGKQVWVTFDDNYALIPGSPSKDTWRGGKKARNGEGAILNEFREGLRLVTGYMTPSKLLTQDFSAYNANGQYVPNYLDGDLWDNLKIVKNPDIITIGYGGTSLHNSSWKESGVIYALGKLCKRYPKVQVHLQTPYPDVVAMLKRSGARIEMGEWVKFEQWPAIVGTFYIGLAPLDGGEYDLRRSSLKTQEFGMAGIPWVATDNAPYKEARGGICVANKFGEWYNALEELISNPALYRKLSEEGREWASAFNGNCAIRYEEVFNR